MTTVTDRLYQRDSFLRSFEARALSLASAGGDPGHGEESLRLDLTLDRTAFYPEGGGVR